VGAVSPAPVYRAVKGTRDLFPPESEKYAAVEAIAREVFGSYGYGEIRTPVLESTELFARSVGETTDIVHKEMYTFRDRGDRSLTMRPENTAGVVRALVQRGIQDVPKPIRLWYTGPQFRNEQPQAGRYREFRQIGAELIGAVSPEADAELLGMLFDFLRRLGSDKLQTRLNCVPAGEGRQAFANALRDYLGPHAEALGPDDRRRLDENPLRLFDSKDPAVQKLLTTAPKTLDYLDERSRDHHEEVKRLLPRGGVSFVEDPSLVRGLDYYTLTVFEVLSESLGAQNSVLGGGRYDDLFTQLGGPPTSAVGFAIGEDRLVSILPVDPRPPKDVVVVIPDSRNEFVYALAVAREIRAVSRDLVVEVDFAGKGLKRGLARAAQILSEPEKRPFLVRSFRAILLGAREAERDEVTVKDLTTRYQESFGRSEVAEKLKGLSNADA
jgi:histidyl-tRNA synthetase